MKDKEKFEIRSYQFDMETNGEEQTDGVGVVIGRPVVYNSRTNIGPFDEIIEAGALDKTNLKDVRFLINHNFNMVPLARSRNNTENSTMRLMPDQDGMKIRVQLDLENNTDARSLYSAIKRGDVSGMSLAFSVDSDEWEDLQSEHPVRHIRSIGQVFEVSAVTFPAYEDTTIGIRSNDKTALESALATLESVRNTTKSLDSDERALQLEKLKAEALYF